MGRRGRNRDKRDAIMVKLEESEPEAYAALVELRGQNPQAYRKELRKWVEYYPIEHSQRVIANRGAIWRGRMLTELDEILTAPFQPARQAIRHGNADAFLDELEAQERAGKDRPLFLQFIQERRKALKAEAAGEKEQRPVREPAQGWGYKPSE